MLKASYLNSLVRIAMIIGRTSVTLPPYTDSFTLVVAESLGYGVSGLVISWPQDKDTSYFETDPFLIEVYSKLLEAEAAGAQEFTVSDPDHSFLDQLRAAKYVISGNKVTWSQE